ncbi:hypothetical protein M404DRAFT_1007136 [Pisolithus tinctorius Marx 270]|uniref:Uncharacterized protein n=1 Tax=Pisolithus tinctorius Marx 270 TaxID=870435 RepID=A0A0C3N4B7_PISTI|nr:hypothetical protein M404DRAFT_1007136 [Pisolithus tinctorius Marx 270]
MSKIFLFQKPKHGQLDSALHPLQPREEGSRGTRNPQGDVENVSRISGYSFHKGPQLYPPK